MLRVLSLSALLCLSIAALAEEAGVDEVLKASGKAVSEEKLDEAAEQLIAETNAVKPKPLAAPAEAKAVPESQIPVLKDERAAKSSENSPWMRLIGCAIFFLMIASVVVVSVKRVAKKKSIGGKKARIEVLHQHFLGPKKSLALVQVAGEAILIGVTDHNISMIKSVALIDDELTGEPQEFNGFLDDEFAVEQLTGQRPGNRVI